MSPLPVSQDVSPTVLELCVCCLLCWWCVLLGHLDPYSAAGLWIPTRGELSSSYKSVIGNVHRHSTFLFELLCIFSGIFSWFWVHKASQQMRGLPCAWDYCISTVYICGAYHITTMRVLTIEFTRTFYDDRTRTGAAWTLSVHLEQTLLVLKFHDCACAGYFWYQCITTPSLFDLWISTNFWILCDWAVQWLGLPFEFEYDNLLLSFYFSFSRHRRGKGTKGHGRPWLRSCGHNMEFWVCNFGSFHFRGRKGIAHHCMPVGGQTSQLYRYVRRSVLVF